MFTQKKSKNYNDEEGLEGLKSANNMNDRRKSQKRKTSQNFNDPESVEANYKTKNSFKKMTERNRQISLALPIKTKGGVLVKNVQTLHHSDDDEDEDNEAEEAESFEKDEADNEPLEMVVEEPKSEMELIREKRDIIEKTKLRIAYLSRGIIENPQGEVHTQKYDFIFKLFK